MGPGKENMETVSSFGLYPYYISNRHGYIQIFLILFLISIFFCLFDGKHSNFLFSSFLWRWCKDGYFYFEIVDIKVEKLYHLGFKSIFKNQLGLGLVLYSYWCWNLTRGICILALFWFSSASLTATIFSVQNDYLF